MKKIISLLLLTTLVSCAQFKTYSPEEKRSESAKINAFFEKNFNEALDRYPTYHTYLGSKKFYDLLDNNTPEFYEAEIEIAKKDLKALKQFNFYALDKQAKLSYKLFKLEKEGTLKALSIDTTITP